MSHRQNCPGRRKNYENCGIANHVARVCRKPKKPYKPKPRVNNVDNYIFEAATVGTSVTVGEQVNHIDRLLRKQGIYGANSDWDFDDYDDNCVAKISIKSDTREVEPVKFRHLYREYKEKSFDRFGERVHYNQ